jgi:hypothetical protein
MLTVTKCHDLLWRPLLLCHILLYLVTATTVTYWLVNASRNTWSVTNWQLGVLFEATFCDDLYRHIVLCDVPFCLVLYSAGDIESTSCDDLSGHILLCDISDVSCLYGCLRHFKTTLPHRKMLIHSVMSVAQFSNMLSQVIHRSYRHKYTYTRSHDPKIYIRIHHPPHCHHSS